MLTKALALLALGAAAAEVYFEESFDGDWEKRWVPGFPEGKEMGKWEVTPGQWYVDEQANKGLATTENMRFHSMCACRGPQIAPAPSAHSRPPLPPLALCARSVSDGA